MSYSSSPWHLALLILFYVVVGGIIPAIPAYVAGRRLGVGHPGVAFVPVVGPVIVALHTIRRSGWLCLLGLIPIASFFFFIWLAWIVPGEHGRTQWWTLAFLIPGVNLVAFYVYAFTLAQPSGPRIALATE